MSGDGLVESFAMQLEYVRSGDYEHDSRARRQKFTYA